MDFILRCEDRLIRECALRYSYQLGDDQAKHIGATVKTRGFMTKPEFPALCKWKTQRSKSRCARNPDNVIEEATRLAISAQSEGLRIGIPKLLQGVDWATASVILHFCHAERYPILDKRAFWTAGIDKMPHITSGIWHDYVQFCRALSVRIEMSMRDLDRGLWQYSKENQPSQ